MLLSYPLINTIGDNLQTNEENDELTLTGNDVLGADSATYSDLAAEIRQSGNITLKHKNYTYDAGATITINENNKVIDGDGAVIDMKGSTIRAFDVTASGVTIKNLTIKNVNYYGDGGAIIFEKSGTVINCNFINNTVGLQGGAIYFVSTGSVTNCNFINNTASEWGGAIMFSRTGTVTNCNFVNNSASIGGAIYSLQWATTADTRIFKRNSGDNVNTVIYLPTLNVDNFTTVYGSGEKLTF